VKIMDNTDIACGKHFYIFLRHGFIPIGHIGDIAYRTVAELQDYGDVVMGSQDFVGGGNGFRENFYRVRSGKKVDQIHKVANLPNNPSSTHRWYLGPVVLGNKPGVNPDVDHKGFRY